MSIGRKFVYRGLGAADYALLLAKEIELLAIEIVGHKEVLAQLLHLQTVVRLSTEQAKAVAAEVEWRRTAIRTHCDLKRKKRDSLAHWKARQREALLRMRRAQVGGYIEERTAACSQ